MDFKLKKSNLNFRVYTAASTPSTGTENDIVIISEVPMTNWILSPDKPSGAPRTDGDVWIQYSTNGDTRNVLKQNTLMITTIFAWQYVNGAWVDKTAKSYQGGEWVGWIPEGYLYWEGNECVPITGGWHSPVDGNIVWTTGGVREADERAKITFSKDHMHCEAIPNVYATWMITANAVDMTGYTKLWIDYTHSRNATQIGNTAFYVMEANPTSILQSTKYATKVPTKTSTRAVEFIDISGIYGFHKFAIVADMDASYNIYNIWLE